MPNSIIDLLVGIMVLAPIEDVERMLADPVTRELYTKRAWDCIGTEPNLDSVVLRHITMSVNR